MSWFHLLPDPGRSAPVAVRGRFRGGRAVSLTVREEGGFAAGRAPRAVPAALIGRAPGRTPLGEAHGRQVPAIRRCGGRSRRAPGILAGRSVEARNLAGGTAARAGHPVVASPGRSGGVI